MSLALIPAATQITMEWSSEKGKARLSKLESEMGKDQAAAARFAANLVEIRDSLLYLNFHKSFAEYCEIRWLITRSSAFRYLAYGKTLRELAVDEDGSPSLLPTPSMGVAKQIESLPAPVRRSAYRKAVENSGGDSPELKQIEQAVAEVTACPVPARKPRRISDVVDAKRAGIIPLNAEVEETWVDDDDEAEPENIDPEPGDELEDFDWLLTLPARASLGDHVVAWFDAEAIAFRHATKHRLKFARNLKPITNAAKKAAKGHIGPWMSLVFRALKANDPTRWRACGECDGTAFKTILGVSDRCSACRGHGYHVGG